MIFFRRFGVVLMLAFLASGPVGSRSAWAEESAAPSLPVVAVLPFHCRAHQTYQPLARTLAMSVCHSLMQSGRVLVAERSLMRPLLDENDLARMGLTSSVSPRPAEGWLGADYLLAGDYDVVNGELIIHAYLIATGQSDYDKVFESVVSDYPSVRVSGRISEPTTVLEDLIAKLPELLPPDRKTITTIANRINPRQNLAVLDFSGFLAHGSVVDYAPAMTELWNIHLQEKSPWTLVERNKTESLLAEYRLQLAGLTDSQQGVIIGRLIGADYLILGHVLSGPTAITVDTQVLEVRTGLILHTLRQSRPLQEWSDIPAQQVEALLVHFSHTKAAAPLCGLGNVRSAEAMVHAARAKLLADGLTDPNAPESQLTPITDLLRLALELDPNSDIVQHYAGSIAWRLHHLESAAEHLTRAYLQAPASSWHNHSLSVFLRTVHSDPQAALPYAQRAVAASPEHHWGKRLELAKCLFQLERFSEAENACRQAMSWNQGPETFGLMARICEKLNRLEEAANYYEQAADFSVADHSLKLRRAGMIWKQLGQGDRAMRTMERLAEHGLAEPTECLELAAFLATKNPARAAALISRLDESPDPNIALSAKCLLDKLPNRPIKAITSPVFDIDLLRSRGVFILLQPYAGFRYSSLLATVQDRLESILGIPVYIAPSERAMPSINYLRAVDKIAPDDRFLADLQAVQTTTSATVVLGLASIDIWHSGRSQIGVRWPRDHCGLVSTANFDRAGGSDSVFMAEVLTKILLDYTARLMLPPEKQIFHALDIHCPLATFLPDQMREKHLFLSRESYDYLQQCLPDWTHGNP